MRSREKQRRGEDVSLVHASTESEFKGVDGEFWDSGIRGELSLCAATSRDPLSSAINELGLRLGDPTEMGTEENYENSAWLLTGGEG